MIVPTTVDVVAVDAAKNSDRKAELIRLLSANRRSYHFTVNPNHASAETESLNEKQIVTSKGAYKTR